MPLYARQHKHRANYELHSENYYMQCYVMVGPIQQHEGEHALHDALYDMMQPYFARSHFAESVIERARGLHA